MGERSKGRRAAAGKERLRPSKNGGKGKSARRPLRPISLSRLALGDPLLDGLPLRPLPRELGVEPGPRLGPRGLNSRGGTSPTGRPRDRRRGSGGGGRRPTGGIPSPTPGAGEPCGGPLLLGAGPGGVVGLARAEGGEECEEIEEIEKAQEPPGLLGRRGARHPRRPHRPSLPFRSFVSPSSQSSAAALRPFLPIPFYSFLISSSLFVSTRACMRATLSASTGIASTSASEGLSLGTLESSLEMSDRRSEGNCMGTGRMRPRRIFMIRPFMSWASKACCEGEGRGGEWKWEGVQRRGKVSERKGG